MHRRGRALRFLLTLLLALVLWLSIAALPFFLSFLLQVERGRAHHLAGGAVAGIGLLVAFLVFLIDRS